MAISPDGHTLFVAESLAHRLTAFTIAGDGTLSDRRVFAQFGEEWLPDGICMDAAGALWLGTFSNEFIRVVDGGTIVDRISVDHRKAIACVLGGIDRRTLFMLTAETSLEELARGQSVGRVEIVRVAIPGAGVP